MCSQLRACGAAADEGVASANSPEAMFEHLCATLLQQSHLCPVRTAACTPCPEPVPSCQALLMTAS